MFDNYELYTKFALQETQCLILNRLKVMKKMMMAFLVALMSVAAVCAQTTATQQCKKQTCAAQKCEKVDKECKNAVEKCDKARTESKSARTAKANANKNAKRNKKIR